MALLVQLVALLTLLAGATPGQTGEYQLKGELLARFADFVEFPDEAFADDSSPFVIGVFGADPFGAVLERAAEGRRIKGRELVVRRFADLADLAAFGSPQVLFIPESERPNYGALFSLLEGLPVLTVGEEPTFARDRGLVNLIIVGNRPDLEIANERAEDLGLRISSQLLRMSRILEREEAPR